jgi:hypothetical protein
MLQVTHFSMVENSPMDGAPAARNPSAIVFSGLHSPTMKPMVYRLHTE